MKNTAAIAGALSDRTRLRIVMALTGGEMCVCQLVELSCLAPSTVSKHLQVLAQAGLIDGRKEGRWIYYSLNAKCAPEARAALKWVRASLSDDPAVLADKKTLKKITAKDKEGLCRDQSKK